MADEQSWMQQRNERRAAGGGAPHGEDHGDQSPGGPLSNERPMGQNIDDRQIGQYSDHGSPPRMKK